MRIVIPTKYWDAYCQFAKDLGIQSPRRFEVVGNEKLSKQNIAALNEALAKENEYTDETKNMRRLMKELLNLASQNWSSDLVERTVKLLKELTTVCNSDVVIMEFINIGGAKLLAPFVCQPNAEVKLSALELTSKVVENRQQCQNSFASAHFIPILMQIASDYSCDVARPKGFYTLFCLCFGNKHVSQLFCECNGIMKLLYLADNLKLGAASCIMLAKILELVPQYKQHACEQGAVYVLADLASKISDDYHRQKAMEAMHLILDECSLLAPNFYGPVKVAEKLKELAEFFRLQESARDLAKSCMDIFLEDDVHGPEENGWEI
ncbi:Putative hspa heat shock 70kda binding protein cy toplasmic cochaperone 1 [Trichuris trichiura]|uniref:Putative hspa heat shock 70kda binding protein cy toplasmic cochaperone 1 n=1 Tax=Trichuris trichiura TaxID=36087 RepID=A0A077Z406_TRITR|nr:Putative hspa heat shock 70kda binding protein cy toplasmic cochaperone 1 [Trichuris trichiura]